MKTARHPGRVTPVQTIQLALPTSDSPVVDATAGPTKLDPDGGRRGSAGTISVGGTVERAGVERGGVERGVRSDEQLIRAYQGGDRDSFAELITRYERELFHFLVRFLGDRAAAEDMFQETFLQVHQSAGLFDPDRRFRPWLFTIAANKARDLMRSKSRRPANPLQASINPGDDSSGEFIDLMKSSQESPSASMEKREMQEKVQATVTNMPEHLREILLLSYFHQFPYRQISDILDIPLGTVKSRLHTAVAFFADRWKSTNPGHLMS